MMRALEAFEQAQHALAVFSSVNLTPPVERVLREVTEYFADSLKKGPVDGRLVDIYGISSAVRSDIVASARHGVATVAQREEPARTDAIIRQLFDAADRITWKVEEHAVAA